MGAHLQEAPIILPVLAYEDPRIPYTSHNSPACIALDLADRDMVPQIVRRAIDHINELASPGSDPGLCITFADAALSEVISFGLACTQELMTQMQAREIAVRAGIYLAGLRGTEDGVIGALAAVGLTAYGWCRRFLEFIACSPSR